MTTSLEDRRLAMLEKMAAGAETGRDPFVLYGLALEYDKRGRGDDALATFERLRALDAGYVPQYLMCGNMLAKLRRDDDARAWYEAGIEAARKKGESKALSELEAALAEL